MSTCLKHAPDCKRGSGRTNDKGDKIVIKKLKALKPLPTVTFTGYLNFSCVFPEACARNDFLGLFIF
jgi:hypothetical protein